jgi:acyl carrier protein
MGTGKRPLKKTAMGEGGLTKVVKSRRKDGMEDFIEELKRKIIDTLELADIRPEDISTDGVLIGNELGLDSIDVLELVMMIEKDYGVKIENREMGVQVFRSVRSLAAYVDEHRRREAG